MYAQTCSSSRLVGPQEASLPQQHCPPRRTPPAHHSLAYRNSNLTPHFFFPASIFKSRHSIRSSKHDDTARSQGGVSTQKPLYIPLCPFPHVNPSQPLTHTTPSPPTIPAPKPAFSHRLTPPPKKISHPHRFFCTNKAPARAPPSSQTLAPRNRSRADIPI